jgi:hypothetical protein
MPETPQGENIAATLAYEFHQLQECDTLFENEEEAIVVVSRPTHRTVEDVTPLLDRYRASPRFLQQTVHVYTVDDFVRYCDQFGSSATVVFVTPVHEQNKQQGPEVLAILDYHEAPGEPSHCRHRVQYPLVASPGWQAWAKSQTFDQRAFAEFIEDRCLEITEPDPGGVTVELGAVLGYQVGLPSEVVRASRGLSLTIEAQVRESHTLANGSVEIQYAENARASEVVVPPLFAVRIPIFEGTDPVELPVRVRYRVTEGRVQWSLLPHRPDLLRDQAFRSLAAALSVRMPAAQVLLGRVG